MTASPRARQQPRPLLGWRFGGVHEASGAGLLRRAGRDLRPPLGHALAAVPAPWRRAADEERRAWPPAVKSFVHRPVYFLSVSI
jgi:hypothetical protein